MWVVPSALPQEDLAYVLRLAPRGEHDRLATLLCRSAGKITVTAPGAAASRRRFAALCPYHRLRVTLEAKPRFRLREAVADGPYPTGILSPGRLEAAAYLLRLADALTRAEQPETTLFDALDQAITTLERGEASAVTMDFIENFLVATASIFLAHAGWAWEVPSSTPLAECRWLLARHLQHVVGDDAPPWPMRLGGFR